MQVTLSSSRAILQSTCDTISSQQPRVPISSDNHLGQARRRPVWHAHAHTHTHQALSSQPPKKRKRWPPKMPSVPKARTPRGIPRALPWALGRAEAPGVGHCTRAETRRQPERTGRCLRLRVSQKVGAVRHVCHPACQKRGVDRCVRRAPAKPEVPKLHEDRHAHERVDRRVHEDLRRRERLVRPQAAAGVHAYKVKRSEMGDFGGG